MVNTLDIVKEEEEVVGSGYPTEEEIWKATGKLTEEEAERAADINRAKKAKYYRGKNADKRRKREGGEGGTAAERVGVEKFRDMTKSVFGVRVKKQLEKHFEEYPCDMDALIEAIVWLIKHRNAEMIKYVWDRLDGKMTEKSELQVKHPVRFLLQPASPQVIEVDMPFLPVIEGEAKELTKERA